MGPVRVRDLTWLGFGFYSKMCTIHAAVFAVLLQFKLLKFEKVSNHGTCKSQEFKGARSRCFRQFQH